MTDRLLATLSMAALIAFLGIVVVFVKEIDLGLIVILCLAIGIYDFWTDLRTRNDDGPNGAGR